MAYDLFFNQIVYAMLFMTHAQYDQVKWEKVL